MHERQKGKQNSRRGLMPALWRQALRGTQALAERPAWRYFLPFILPTRASTRA